MSRLQHEVLLDATTASTALLPMPMHELHPASSCAVYLQVVKDQRGKVWHVMVTNKRGVITLDGLGMSGDQELCFLFTCLALCWTSL